MIVWNIKVKDKSGTISEYVSRGAPDKAAAERAAMRDIVVSQTRRALDSGAEDPGLQIVSIEPGGEDDSPMGAWVPPGTKPVDLDKFAKGGTKKPIP
jgi:hypothetical protein